VPSPHPLTVFMFDLFAPVTCSWNMSAHLASMFPAVYLQASQVGIVQQAGVGLRKLTRGSPPGRHMDILKGEWLECRYCQTALSGVGLLFRLTAAQVASQFAAPELLTSRMRWPQMAPYMEVCLAAQNPGLTSCSWWALTMSRQWCSCQTSRLLVQPQCRCPAAGHPPCKPDHQQGQGAVSTCQAPGHVPYPTEKHSRHSW
jgi:hypothetical protein